MAFELSLQPALDIIFFRGFGFEIFFVEAIRSSFLLESFFIALALGNNTRNFNGTLLLHTL